MTRPLRSSPLMLSLWLLALASPAIAQVDYRENQPRSQRADSGPDALIPGWYYNLGLTGIRAELVENQAKAYHRTKAVK